jgi:membrane protein DedA with SNARE-associated domain
VGGYIQNFAVWIESSKYFLIFLGAIPEGPVLMMTSGFLYRLGELDFAPMYLALIAGDFTADIIFYCIGRYATREAVFRYGYVFNVTPKAMARVESLFNKYHQKILIVSKLTVGFGFGFITLIAAGMFRVDFKKYAAISILGGMTYTFFFILVGYLFGNVFTLIPESVKLLFLLGVILIIIFGLRLVHKYFKDAEF